ncbi:MAG: hypothetical protein FJ087_22110, partial [Deltaproteobacteria bacterium]|nr:hypothetical protein [Deltaproteobacteria bacterium]
MSELEIREIIRAICDRLDRRVAAGMAAGVGLALSPGCDEGGGGGAQKDVAAEVADPGVVPPYMAPDTQYDPGPADLYGVPDPGPETEDDPGVVPPYMAPDPGIDPGPMDAYGVPDPGPEAGEDPGVM